MKRMLTMILAGLGAITGAWGQRLPETVVPESYELTFERTCTPYTFPS